jgi:hypothetical protein
VLLVAVNALVGGMIGQERTVLPLLAPVARPWLRGRGDPRGVVADRLGMAAAIGVVAALTAASGLVVLVRMPEAPIRR